MAVFSGQTLAYARICFLLTISFYFMKDPDYLFRIPFVILLAKSMDLPFIDVDPYNAAFGVLSFVFALLALGDLVPLLEHNVKYFESAVPTRLLVYFGTAAYACMGSNYFICNNAVFVYCFFEIFFNALMFSTFKEEQYERERSQEIAKADAIIEEELIYGEGGEDEDDPEYERVVSDIRERVRDL